jgi:exonuclease III
MQDNILVWNVRGLDSRSHRDMVRSLIASERSSLICLQETKMNVISNIDIMQFLSVGYDYVFLPAFHTRGGILVT